MIRRVENPEFKQWRLCLGFKSLPEVAKRCAINEYYVRSMAFRKRLGPLERSFMWLVWQARTQHISLQGILDQPVQWPAMPPEVDLRQALREHNCSSIDWTQFTPGPIQYKTPNTNVKD